MTQRGYSRASEKGKLDLLGFVLFVYPRPSSEYHSAPPSLSPCLIILQNTRWLVHPHSKAKVRWDLMVAVMIFYSTLLVPFRIGFEEMAGVFGVLVDVVVDIGFALDIALSFRTAFVDEVTN